MPSWTHRRAREMLRHQTKRCLTLPRVGLACVLLVVCRLWWRHLNELDTVPEHYQAAVLSVPPKSCIMAANGSCVPEKADDVYLGRGLYAHKDSFYLDGRKVRILSGSFHYFRTQPVDWGDRLMKMKAAGLNTVTTYVPWNLHEPVKGQVNLRGRWDLASFIKQAQRVGLLVIVRPGPYICAEWEFGGLPAWLLRDPDMVMRSSYAPFLSHVEEYFNQLLPVLVPLTYKKGGPIIAFQVENEYGSYGTDRAYLDFLVEQYRRHGLEELYFTSDGTEPNQLKHGTIPGVLATANFKDKPQKHLDELRAFQPDKPLMVAEFWPGWFDHWSEGHHNMTAEVFEERVSVILDMGASINFYMFVGGTNFEFWNGANMNKPLTVFEPTVTSYDYDAPISEDGSLKEKFYITQKLLKKYSEPSVEQIKLGPEVPKEAYGKVAVEKWLPYKSLTDIAQDYTAGKYAGPITRQSPVTMEFLDLVNNCGQNMGFLLYRAEIETNKPQALVIDGDIRDRAQILLNSELITTVYRNDPLPPITLPARPALPEGISHLDIFIENMGRVNYKSLDTEVKGLAASVDVGGAPVDSWTHIPLDLAQEFTATLAQQDLWMNFPTTPANFSCPAVFRAHLNIDTPPRDTFVDMAGWTKGVVVVNGFTLGRYWRVGPQRTLYLPGALLAQGRNVILVLELHKPHTSITFTDKPLLDHKW